MTVNMGLITRAAVAAVALAAITSAPLIAAPAAPATPTTAAPVAPAAPAAPGPAPAPAPTPTAPAATASPVKEFFPKPQEIEGWVMTSDLEYYPGKRIFDLIDGAGEVYMTYNFVTAAASEYTGPDGAALAVEIYTMGTPEDAYGIYAYGKPAKSQAVNAGQEAFAAGTLGGLWKGAYFVKVQGLDDKPATAAAVSAFLTLIGDRIPAAGSLPDIFKALPSDRMEKGSIKFLRSSLALANLHFLSGENVLKLDKDTSMVIAQYALPPAPAAADARTERVTAFVVVYPNEAAAVAAAAGYSTFLGSRTDAEGAWFKQKGRAIVGMWSGRKAVETLEISEPAYSLMRKMLNSVEIYQLQK